MSGLGTNSDLRIFLATLEAKLEIQALQLTVRLGTMLAAGIAILVAIVKLT